MKGANTGVNVGLFKNTGTNAKIRNLGLVGVNVTGGSGNDYVGSLVGRNDGGDILSCYAVRRYTDFLIGIVFGEAKGGAGVDVVGGLVGQNEAGTGSSITASYAIIEVDGGSGNGDKVGGLVGYDAGGSILSSYAGGHVNGGAGTSDLVGGLVGEWVSTSAIRASYARGHADGGDGATDEVGALVGKNDGPPTDSFGFGFVAGAEITNTVGTGTALPANVSGPGDLRGNAADRDTYAGASWLADTWIFGMDTLGPRLKYADYDGASVTFSCDTVPEEEGGSAVTCGTTEIPEQTSHPVRFDSSAVTATATSCVQIDLTWDHPKEHNRKEVEITWEPDAPDSPRILNDFSTTQGTTSITGLKDNTAYTFTVFPRDNDDRVPLSLLSSFSRPNATTTACGALTAPTTITSTATMDSVTLTWTNPTELDFKHVTISYRENTPGSAVTNVAAAQTGTSYTVNDLEADTEYTFTLTAVDTSDNTESATHTKSTTAAAGAGPGAGTGPAEIQDFEATPVLGNCSQMNLAWTAPTELNLEELRITWEPSMHGETQPVRITDFSTTTRVITGLRSNTEYDFTIVSEDNADNISPQAQDMDVMTSTCAALEAPTIRPSVRRATSIVLNWTNPSQTDFTHVTISYVGGPTIPNQTGAADDMASYEVDGLTADTEYEFTITAVDTSGDTEAATAFTVRTLVDTDGDGVGDENDVDADNDGLIEIRSLEMLLNIQNDLDGHSYDTDDADTNADYAECRTNTDSDKGSVCGAPTAGTEAIANCVTARDHDTDPATDGIYLCGYELAGNLDFEAVASYRARAINYEWLPANVPNPTDGATLENDPDAGANPGFPGLGSVANGFAAIFEGNGRSISNLYMRQTATTAATKGLFNRITSAATIRNLGLNSANIYGNNGADTLGLLVGENSGGTILASYAKGVAKGGDSGTGGDAIGGLVGQNEGIILASYAMVDVDGEAGQLDKVGGLVGEMDTTNARIIACYATGDVNGGDGDGDDVGGLVGSMATGTILRASYATGAVDGGSGTTDTVGALVGANTGTTNIVKSYGFGTTTNGDPGIDESDDNTANTATEASALRRDMTQPTVDVGAEWNDATEDTLSAWDFGTGADPHPPMLRYADYDDAGNDYSCAPNQFGSYGATITCGATLITGQLPDADGDGVIDSLDVDDDNDGLIEIRSLEMLLNIQNDLDGHSYDTDDPDAATYGTCETPTTRGSVCGAPTDGTSATALANCGAARDHDGVGGTTPAIYLCGYELARDLDFAAADSYSGGAIAPAWLPNDAPTSTGARTTPDAGVNPGFPGLGASSATATSGGFGAIFEGNGFQISNLYMRNTDSTVAENIGLFRRTESTAVIRNFGLVHANIYSESNQDDESIGILVGHNNGGTILASHTKGTMGLTGSGNARVGGLVGESDNTSKITASFSEANITGGTGQDTIGGLLGYVDGGTIIVATYALATLEAGTGTTTDTMGGLIGYSDSSTIRASFVNGVVNGDAGNDYIGFLVGRKGAATTTIEDSYSFATSDRGVTDTNSGTDIDDGSTIPRCNGFPCTPAQLTEANVDSSSDLMGIPPVPSSWNDEAKDTLNAWEFGSIRGPKLKYADYDGAGADYGCANDQFRPYGELITCGTTELGGQVPSAINNFAATVTNCATVALAWDHPTGINRKEVRITWEPTSTLAGSPSQPVVLNDFSTASGSSSIAPLQDSTDYTFTIVSRDQDDQDSAPVTSTVTTTGCAALTAPTGITSVATNTTVTLNWTNPSQEDFSHVSITYTPGGVTIPPQVMAAGANDSYIVTGLTASTSYDFTLTSHDTSGNTQAAAAHTKATTSTTPTAPNPSVIQGFRATPVLLDCTKMDLEWIRPEELDRKEVRISGTPEDGRLTGTGTTPIALTDFTNRVGTTQITGLKSNTPYTFSIVSRNNNDDDSTAATDTATTSTCGALQAPVITGHSRTTNSVTLNWTNPPQKDFTHVTITVTPTTYRDGTTTITIPNQTGAPGATASYTIGTVGGPPTSSLAGGTEYVFGLDSVNTRNQTATATSRTVTTLPDADGDGVIDSLDVDDDNDGLIEIHSLEMLLAIQNDLAGRSYDTDPDDNDADYAECTTNTDSDKGSVCGAPTDGTSATALANCGAARDHDGVGGTPAIYLCGYELARDLDFKQDASYADTANKADWCPNLLANCNSTALNASGNFAHSGFPGIGDKTGTTVGFNAIFEGNGLSISNLYMRSDTPTAAQNMGLFRLLRRSAKVRNLGLLGAHVYGSNHGADVVGSLVGYNNGANITSSYAMGAVDGAGGDDDLVGGLVGHNQGANGTTAKITASYAVVQANGGAGDNDLVGGLVGKNDKAPIAACYARGAVTGGAGDSDKAGGLVGESTGETGNLSTITASYASGLADGGDGATDTAGSLVASSSNTTVTRSFGFTASVGETTSDTAPPTDV